MFCSLCPSSSGFAGPSPSRRSWSSQLARRMSSSADDTTTAIDNVITTRDVRYMTLASRHARMGLGNTYPNPAVGCVIVRGGGGGDDDAVIIGAGFHPRAGLPHAEVFALFEACGHVEDGVEAARACVRSTRRSDDDDGGDESKGGSAEKKVLDLLDIYASEGGPTKLFGGAFADTDGPVTAYVTLEPCCHYGQTPPCAKSLLEAGVDRVVVGFRDPNPRVDGGGVSMLRDAGVRVDLMGASSPVDGGEGEDAAAEKEREAAARECEEIVKCFAKRIAPRSDGPVDYETTMNGKKRRALRSLAGRKKAEGTLETLEWPRGGPSVDVVKDGDVDDLEERVNALPLDHRWLEEMDRLLWEEELVQLKLSGAVAKKRGAKILGGRVADELGAHVAQVVGHTALCYRPGLPPVLDLDEMVSRER